MTRYIISLLTCLCVCFGVVSCGQEEASSVTACDNASIANMVKQYNDIIEEAVNRSDCSTLLTVSPDVISFIDNNYNCLIIYFVLTDDDITTDREAEEYINDIREFMLDLTYACELENTPVLN
ncbi:hypothetical protein [Flammeovirga aprica]|uniref:Uncharacterized protein n=1 Tax=Flammeovirga aprica JL-4 TaxID=694437 RepID=A0A7X9NZP6_9BACT|nr:hypothetical protein [Flammeovirga aprica]NME66879.1 hypothetical protein [Flammeovirga aprica JL-4]